MLNVAPARERGLKYASEIAQTHLTDSRSRKGAWIEIPEDLKFALSTDIVAPARERGLKY